MLLRRGRTLKVLAISGVITSGAVGVAAAAGALPSAAQNGLATAASHVGMTLPASHDNHPSKNSHPGDAPDSPSTSSSASTTIRLGVTPTTTANHGSVVSNLARTTTATGRDKGMTISAAARGDHGQTPPTPTTGPSGHAGTNAPTSTPPVSTPNSGGLGTGDTASGGTNATGASNAAPQAAAGSANAGSHPGP
jgi:hypothetical protein